MRQRSLLVLCAVGALMVSGCSARPNQAAAAPDPFRLSGPAPAEPRPPLLGAVEPEDFSLPTVASSSIAALLPSFLVTQPLNPSLAALPDGRLLAASPTCDRPEPLGADFQNRTQQEGCEHRIVYLSDEQGGSWERLNQGERNRLDRRQERPYGDVDVAADGSGALYVAMDDAGYNDLFVLRSEDAGATWQATLSEVEPRTNRDQGPKLGDGRIAAAGLDRVVVGWRACETQNTSCWIGVRASFSGGLHWSPPARFGDYVRGLGPFVVGPGGADVHAAFWEGQAVGDAATLRLLSSRNFGVTWSIEDLGVVVGRSVPSSGRDAPYGLPVVAPLGGGGFAVAWTEEVQTPGDAATPAHAVRYAVKLPGSDWTMPARAPDGGTARLPWVVAGAGDRFALLYWGGSAVPTDEALNAWDLRILLVDFHQGVARTLEGVLVPRVHVGALCGGAMECLAGNPRLWIDSFGAAARPDGSLAFTYPQSSGANVEWRAAVQTGGSPLFVPAQS